MFSQRSDGGFLSDLALGGRRRSRPESTAPDAVRRFSDGADYRIEIPTVNSVDTFRAILGQARHLGVRINRVTETLGLFRHTEQEIREYVTLARDAMVDLVFSVGPRATYDTGASSLTDQGRYVAYRLRGMDQVRRALDDVARGLEYGVHSFLIYDEGLLETLSRARSEGLVPSNVALKASAHMGYANPISIRLLERLGADTINPIRDLPIDIIAELREHVRVPLDLHLDNPASSGGFIRTYDAPAIVESARPVHLKTGNSAVGAHGAFTTAEDGRRMVDQAAIAREFMQRFDPEWRQSGADLPDQREHLVARAGVHGADRCADVSINEGA